MLAPTSNRLTVYPIEHAELWKLYKDAQASIWTVEEVDLNDDSKDWNETLTQPERKFILEILAFFAASDGIVAENLVENFATEVQWPEARCFYGLQIAVENVHNETYSLFIATFADSVEQRDRLLTAATHTAAIKQKANWALAWCNAKTNTFAERLIAFAIVEGVFFSGAFCAIFWLKKRGLMPGLAFANELISRDEALHCRFACALNRKLVRPAAPLRIQQMVTEAVAIEQDFVRHALPVSLIGMNARTMSAYIEFVADHLLVELGQPKTYHTPNPYEWMTSISLQGKTNFFEKRVGEYARSGVGQSTTDHHTFGMDASF
jgi:ribonucleotide reductase beta subunit family protein with ferritin-like domain